MTYGERRINAIITNYAKGAYTLAYLKDILARGLQHVDCYGVKGVDRRSIENLAHIETAIKRIEAGQSKQKEN